MKLDRPLVSGPEGLSVDAQTGRVVWNPAAADIGNHGIVLRVEDALGGVAEQEYLLAAINPPPNRPPVILSAPVVDASVNVGYRYQVEATDADSDSLTYTLAAGPEGMAIDTTTGELTWTPTGEQLGGEFVTVSVADGEGGTAEQSFEMFVGGEPGNRAPIIVSPADKKILVGQSLSHYIDAVDPDADSLTFALVSHPDGMTIDSETGEIGWDTTSQNAGNYEVTVRVEDGRGGFDTQTIAIELLDVQPGEIHGSNFHDLNRNAIWDGEAVHLPPLNPALNPRTFSNTDFVSAGRGSLWFEPNAELTLSGVSGKVTRAFLYWHGPSNSFSPTANARINFAGQEIVGSNIGFSSDNAWSYRNSQSYKADVTSLITGDGNYSIDASATESPDGEAIRTNGASLIVFFDDGDDANNRDVVLFEGNDSNSPSDFFDPPRVELTLPGINYVLGTVNMEIHVSDGQGRGADEEIVINDTTIVPLGGHFAGNSVPGRLWDVLSYDITSLLSPGFNTLNLRYEPFPSRVSTRDRTSLVAAAIDLPANTAPAIEPGLSDWIVYLDENRNDRRDLGERFATTDAKGNYSFTDLPPGNYPIAVEPKDGWQQTEPLNRTHEITITGGENFTGINFGSFELEQERANNAPTFTSQAPTDAIAEDVFIYKSTATDADRDYLTYDLAVAPVGMAVSPHTGTVIWQPSADQVGVHDAVLRVQDAYGGIDLQSFQITVAPANTVAAIASTPPGTAVINRPYQYRFRAQDADLETLSFRLDTPLEGMTLDSDTGILNWTPTESQLGQQSVTIAVIDSAGAETSQNFDFSVVASTVNADPTITSTPRETIGLGGTYLYQLQATDPNGDPLTYIVESGPAGMTVDQLGRISWQPGAAQFGSNPVSLRVEDGQGGIARQNFAINVTATTANQAPSIDSVPSQAATAFEQYIYDAAGSDPDGDLLWWSLDAAPEGMSIDPERGTIRWTPTAEQIGQHEIAVRVADSLGAFVGQSFTISVRGVNVPPVITSAPPTLAAADKSYNYLVQAVDAESQPLNFSLPSAPEGMVIDSATGLISWTPSQSQIGSHNIEVVVEDSDFAVTTQSYTVVVSTTAPNQAPVITSSPVAFANLGQTYQYPVAAYDPDGEAVQFQLLEKPDDTITIDPQTGAISWTPTSEGVYTVAVGATDPQGLGAAQRFTIDVAAPVPPVVSGQPITEISPGETYRYNVNASSPRGELLSFSLDSAPVGMTVDQFGRIVWNPTENQVGIHPVSLTITDPRGNSTVESYELTVVGDSLAPLLSLFVSQDTLDLGESVTIVVNATDNVGVENLSLTIDGTAVALDPNGRATVPMNDLGEKEVVALATDAAGNFDEASRVLNVLDFSEEEAPVVELSSLLGEEIITGPVDIVGTVTDGGSTPSYVLEAAPAVGGEFVEIFQGSGQVTNGVLGSFDPSLLENDSYILRLTATDSGGNSSSVEEIVDVSGELKLGNFRLSFTDLEIPVSGIPISVTRTYDTLTAGHQDDFGYGWRLEFRDTDLRTSVGRDELYEQTGIGSVAFKEGTRVYVTLPGGKRTGFTFKPVMDPEIRKALRMGAPLPPSLIFYNPAFETDDGEQVTLSTNKTRMLLNRDTGEYYDLSGTPYNPVNSFFGGSYKLTTKEGTLYVIDARNGDLHTATDPNGNVLTFSDAGIKSDSGVEVTFERDAEGRIVSVIDPEGNKIGYSYDENGDLVAVTDRSDNTTELKYEIPERAHYLNEIIDPLGRSGVRSEYDESGRLSRMLDVNGEAVQLSYDPDNSTQTVLDQFGNPTTYVYDDRGNVVSEVDPVGLVTNRTYDDNNRVLSQTAISTEYDSDGKPTEFRATTSFTYDSNGNLATVTDPLGNVRRYTLNESGRLLTKTDALGKTTTYTYDSRGNRRTLTNALGYLAEYNFDLNGNITEMIDVDGNVTRFEFDAFGNTIRKFDNLGNETTYTYDANGNQLTEAVTVTTNDGSMTRVTSWTYDTENRVKSKTDPEGNVIRHEYDEFGNLTAIIEEGTNRRTQNRYNHKNQLEEILYPDGTFERFIYDEADRTIATRDRAGHTTHFKHDAVGRLIETIYPDDTPADLDDNPRTKTEYNKIGRITARIDERGNRTEYEYDASGRRTLVRDALGNETTYTYDAEGNRLTETDARNQTTKFVYDKLGRPVETIFADGSRTITAYNKLGLRSAFTDQAGRTTHFIYDALDRLVEVIHPDNTPNDLSNNPRTKTEYDEVGQVIAEIDELGNRNEYKYDALGRRIEARIGDENNRWTYTYDAAGNQIAETDPLGHTTQFVYDELDRLTETHFHDKTYNVVSYDELGRPKTLTDQGRKTTEFEYDERGLLTAVIDPLGQRTEYNYDLGGNLVRIKDANNHIVKHEYDKLDRRTATILPMGQRSETTYDPVGNIASTIDFNQDIITYQYDKLNRMSVKRFPDDTTVEYSYTSTGQIETIADLRGITSYSYDARSRLAERIEPDGSYIRYTYDLASNRTAVITPTGTTQYAYDSYNQLESVTAPQSGVTQYTYDLAGNLIETELPNSTKQIREYDELNRLIYLENNGPEGIISSYSYTLDPVGNRLAVEENGDRRADYTYDALYRLRQESIASPTSETRTIDYTYDAVGNRQTRTDSLEGVTTYSYNNNDWLLNETHNGEATTYTYDNNGNTLSRNKNVNDLAVYRWDYSNQLIGARVTSPSGMVETAYQYDSDGIRVASTVDGQQETRYLIDANQPYARVLEEYAPDGTVRASYTYGHHLISQNRGGQPSFYHVDGLGSTTALSDASGNVTDSYNYDAYGNLTNITGNATNRYLFTGEQYDPNLGHYYLRARYYNPGLGRFSSRDPFEGFLTEPLSLAKYPYVHGNPVNATDPSGLLTKQEQATAVSLVTLLAVTTYAYLTRPPSKGLFERLVVPDYLVGQGNEGVDRMFAESRRINAAALLNVLHMQQEARQCQANNEICDFQGYPVIIWGTQDLPQTTRHIHDAITGQGGGFQQGAGMAPTFLARIQPSWDRRDPQRREKGTDRNGNAYPYNWYDFATPCLWHTFNGPARNGDGLTCDEYPFASTVQGGRINYERNQVSVRLVRDSEQLQGPPGRRHWGSQFFKMRQFYDRAQVEPNHPTRSWFGVQTVNHDESHWFPRESRLTRRDFDGDAQVPL